MIVVYSVSKSKVETNKQCHEGSGLCPHCVSFDSFLVSTSSLSVKRADIRWPLPTASSYLNDRKSFELRLAMRHFT